jgi:AcrR family transcriptional regulator
MKEEAAGGSARMRIIRAAAELFHKQGVHLTSPDEIIEASGTGKGQFYHYFKNKEGLIHAVMQCYLDDIENGTSQVNFDIDSWEGLQGWFERHLELQIMSEMTRACPIGAMASDVTERDELIRQDVALILDVMRRKLGNFFRKEKAAGRLAKEADEEALATFCLGAVQGGMLLGRIARASRPAAQVVSEALAHIRTYWVGSQT